MRFLPFAALIAAVAAPVWAQQQATVPNVVMEDQFERPQDVRAHRGKVVVLIYGDRASANANKALGEMLHVAFHPTAQGQPPAKARGAPPAAVVGAPAGSASPDVLAVPVACVGKVPQVVRRIIRTQVRGGSPDVPVWLDFDDTMKGQFPFKAGVPNVVVLDGQGRYRVAASGLQSRAEQQKLVDQIEGLRREAITPAPR